MKINPEMTILSLKQSRERGSGPMLDYLRQLSAYAEWVKRAKPFLEEAARAMRANEMLCSNPETARDYGERAIEIEKLLEEVE